MDRQGVGVMATRSIIFSHLKYLAGLAVLILMLHGSTLSQTDSTAQYNDADKRAAQWTEKLKNDLNLTDDQAAKVRDILSSTKSDINADVSRYNNDIQKDIQDRLDKADSDLMNILTTSEQKEQYNKLRDQVRSDISRDSTSDGGQNDQIVNNYYRNGYGYDYGWWWYPGFYWSSWYPGYYWRGYYPHYYGSFYRHGYVPYSRYYRHPYNSRGYSRPFGTNQRMSTAPRGYAPQMSAPRMGGMRGGAGMGGMRGGGGRRGR
jgi:hypothetical protein